jgi:hypothetical protein
MTDSSPEDGLHPQPLCLHAFFLARRHMDSWTPPGRNAVPRAMSASASGPYDNPRYLPFRLEGCTPRMVSRQVQEYDLQYDMPEIYQGFFLVKETGKSVLARISTLIRAPGFCANSTAQI